VGDADAALPGRRHVDAVVTYAEHHDDLQRGQALDQLSADRGLAVGDQSAYVGRGVADAGAVFIRLNDLVGGVERFVEHRRQTGDFKEPWLHRDLG
jgi:hypothetical protein